jgi:hypothetical protein
VKHSLGLALRRVGRWLSIYFEGQEAYQTELPFCSMIFSPLGNSKDMKLKVIAITLLSISPLAVKAQTPAGCSEGNTFSFQNLYFWRGGVCMWRSLGNKY